MKSTREEKKKQRKRDRHKKQPLWFYLAMGLAVAVFVFSAWQLGSIVYRDHKSEAAFEDLAQVVSAAKEKAEKEEIVVEEGGPLPEYKELAETNPDLVGWLKIDGTDLNYPVMHTPESPQYYLRRNFDKKWDYSGTPFLDHRCDPAYPSTNLIIHGHNMKNGGMFKTVAKYEDEAFWKEHPTVHFDTLTEHRTYEVAAVFKTEVPNVGEPGFRYYDFINAKTPAEFDAFAEELKKVTLYDTGKFPQYGDELLTLSTCSYHAKNGRIALVARRIDK